MQFTRRLLFLAAAFAIFLLPISASAADEEAVEAFSADITVRADGVVSITEKIDYYFPQPKHGFYRDIPIRYTLDDGSTVVVPVEVKSVEGAPYKLERGRSYVRVKIGDPDKTVSGMQTYTIVYEVRGAIRRFEDHDELYWNVTGSDWQVPVRRVAAMVYLPDSIKTEDISQQCFTGEYGSKEHNCLYNRSRNSVHFAAGGSLTAVVAWKPVGAVAYIAPEKPTFWSDYVEPNLAPLALALALPIAAFVYLYRRWLAHGRDPRGRGTLVVQYDPPDKLTPAEVGVLLDERADLKDVTATIVDLAVRGYLRITELPKKMLARQDYEFALLKRDYVKDATLKKHEKEILGVMFGNTVSVELSRLVSQHAFHKKLNDINNALYDQTVSGGYFPESPGKVRQKYATAGVIALMIGGFLAENLWMAAVALIPTGLLLLVFGRAMPRKTDAGVTSHEHAEGFREYLATAEKYRLQWQEKERVFETFLPYAMVFGVVDKWSQAFKDISLPPPDWYHGTAVHAGAFNAASFGAAMSGLQGGLTRAVSATPQKGSSGSGMGGGGFSGGGFGGGGGGSW